MKDDDKKETISDRRSVEGNVIERKENGDER